MRPFSDDLLAPLNATRHAQRDRKRFCFITDNNRGDDIIDLGVSAQFIFR